VFPDDAQTAEADNPRLDAAFRRLEITMDAVYPLDNGVDEALGETTAFGRSGVDIRLMTE
jgi:hypothetical protein